MDEGLEKFMVNHFLKGLDPHSGYHLSLGVHYAYLVDAMEYAQMVEDGEVVDEVEVALVLRNLKTSFDALALFKKRLGVSCGFDPAELVTLKGCSLENGRIKGEVAQAVSTARSWLRHYLHHRDEALRKESSVAEDEKNRNSFLYEVGAYILYLCREEVEYNFLRGYEE